MILLILPRNYTIVIYDRDTQLSQACQQLLKLRFPPSLRINLTCSVLSHETNGYKEYRRYKKMKILITGGSGFVGSALSDSLKLGGHEIFHLVRKQPHSSNQYRWDPRKGEIDLSAIEIADVVIHLAGENVASGYWLAAKKKRIRDSRVNSSLLLADAISRAKSPPKVLLSASGIGYYGDRPNERLTEDSNAGSGFLASLALEWESAILNACCRAAVMRFGIVFGKGGALSKMVIPFRLGLGGRIGSGKQMVSWISLRDLVRAVEFLISNDSLRGPFNFVSGVPTSNAELTKVIGKVLGRPTFANVPEFAAKLAFGEMASEMLLVNQEVYPARLSEHGFKFSDRDLTETIKWCLRT